MQAPALQTPTITNPPAFALPQKPAAELLKPAAEPVKPAARPAERNEFQQFIEASTGQRLPIFGLDLFEGAPSTFAPVENIAVPADYVIGPGDELLVRAWGQIDVDYRAVVDRNGTISIPRVGSINVAGVKYQDLTNFVRAAVARNFRNFELLVTLGQLRSVQIFVVGYARRPGSYTVSSLSTLMNAIFAAGGPSAAGSMRGMQLKRGNRTITELDLYDLLLTGDKSRDVALLPGDVIYFPPIGPLAAVAGSVNQPAIFELKGHTSLGNLVGYAGGMSTVAQSRQATIERIDNRSTRSVEQVDLDFNAAQRPVKDGDLVSVLAIHAQVRERRDPARQRRHAAALPAPPGHAHPRPDPGQGSADHARLLQAPEPRRAHRHRHAGPAWSPTCAGSPTKSTGTTPASSASGPATSPPSSSPSTSAKPCSKATPSTTSSSCPATSSPSSPRPTSPRPPRAARSW